MTPIRVLVVEDSLTVRARLRSTLAADPQLDVVGEAADGAAAFAMCRDLRPDIVTMDLSLPVMSGLTATEQIMAHCPTPILIVSAAENRGELFQTYEALAAGAVDSLDKPRVDEPAGAWERRLIATVKLVSRIRVIRHPRARLNVGVPARAAPVAPPSSGDERRPFQVVAMGTSTGGPAALVEVLRTMPANHRPPVLIVLHIGEPFALGIPEWLSGETGRTVQYARGGEKVADLGGRVVMAPPGRHLVMRDGRLRLTEGPERHSCRPSVDVLFESVAVECGVSAAAVLLTGMGRDGALGLLDVRRSGGLTIAQDEATSVVYGMPREAALIAAAALVLPLGEIGPQLARLRAAPHRVGRHG